MTAAETFAKNDRVAPFSNGTEHYMWLARNCERGKKGCRRYNPDASSSRHGCPIEVAIAFAAGGDGSGKIKAGIALRGGFLTEGPGGMLVHADGDASTLRCPEYIGYDEPDDRPRRGPRPSDGQIDLLDPRNVPDRERVA